MTTFHMYKHSDTDPQWFKKFNYVTKGEKKEERKRKVIYFIFKATDLNHGNPFIQYLFPMYFKQSISYK